LQGHAGREQLSEVHSLNDGNISAMRDAGGSSVMTTGAMPGISVVVPSFNQAAFLERTLRSILDQQYPNLELIVIDGGSQDKSVEIIRKYEQHISYWVSEPDGGQTLGLIKGFKRATGEIQCWLNSDDLFWGSCLFEVAEQFSKRPEVDAIYGDTIWIDEQDRHLRVHREIGFNRFLWLYTYNYVPGMSLFWRKKIYDRVGGLDGKFNLSMDADLIIRFAESGTFKHVRRTWSCCRFYPEQKMRRLQSAAAEEDQRIRRRYIGGEAPWVTSIKKRVAMAVRILWKTGTFCYSLRYKRRLEG
jgi:GT2 family glycosyltransferase